MADNVTSPKKSDFVRAFLDLLILGLLLVAACFGGYWWGLHERLAPIETVAPGTPGAITQSQLAERQSSQTSRPGDASATESPSGEKKQQDMTSDKPSKSSSKYWLVSSGTDYTGYSITVSVNGDQVDNFFGPGKIVDITSHVNSGDNTITFDAKQLGEQYNRHSGESKSILSVKLVSGSKISEDFKPSDVALSYSRNAAESKDFNDTMHFTAK
ncbi:MAG: hypothetical protein IPM23_22145 [Candidatus Melainabacteria bacterium]|nr:hypothetical protein [Candidatus Melainabacteria bacterium]